MSDQKPTPDLDDFVLLGAKLAEVGGLLTQKRAERAQLDQEINMLEQQLGPLLVRQGELTAQLTGRPIPRALPASQNMGVGTASNLGPNHLAVAPQPVHTEGVSVGPDAGMPQTYVPISVSTRSTGSNQLRERVKAYLLTCEAGTSSHDIAEKLQVDSAIVRSVMRETVDATR